MCTSSLWLTQKAIGQLFDVDRSVVTKLDSSVVTKHLKNIFDSEELSEAAVCAKLHRLLMMGKPINQSDFDRLIASTEGND